MTDEDRAFLQHPELLRAIRLREDFLKHAPQIRGIPRNDQWDKNLFWAKQHDAYVPLSYVDQQGVTHTRPLIWYDLGEVFLERSPPVYVDVVWTRARDMFTPARFRKEGMYWGKVSWVFCIRLCSICGISYIYNPLRLSILSYLCIHYT